MQIFASDSRGEKIEASHALRKRPYYCLECRKPVHLRGGRHRRLHFYHLKPSFHCRQSGKSPTHLAIQLAIQKRFGSEETILEHRFPSIGRIADLFCPARKLIFEIQCSSLSKEEVLERNADYGSLGLQVVWIFHEAKFNRYKLTEAESVLFESPHYYTNIRASGSGIIYDQYALDRGPFRVRKSFRLPIALEKPFFLKERPLPAPLSHREQWPLFFEGDLVDRREDPLVKRVLLLPKSDPFPWKRVVKEAHSSFLRRLLRQLTQG